MTEHEHESDDDGTCTDHCVATHPDHAETRGERPEGVEPIIAWDDMDDAAKRYHLAWSHGYLPAEHGGWEPTDERDDPRGSDAWVLDGTLVGTPEQTTALLDSLHAEDHDDQEGGGGKRKHFHPGRLLTT